MYCDMYRTQLEMTNESNLQLETQGNSPNKSYQ